jgi:hypothetical protein
MYIYLRLYNIYKGVAPWRSQVHHRVAHHTATAVRVIELGRPYEEVV